MKLRVTQNNPLMGTAELECTVEDGADYQETLAEMVLAVNAAFLEVPPLGATQDEAEWSDASGKEKKGKKSKEESTTAPSEEEPPPAEAEEKEEESGGNEEPEEVAKKPAKKLRKKNEVYDRENEIHKKLFTKEVTAINPDWRDSEESKAKVKKASLALAGEEFLSPEGKVLPSVIAQLKKAVK